MMHFIIISLHVLYVWKIGLPKNIFKRKKKRSHPSMPGCMPIGCWLGLAVTPGDGLPGYGGGLGRWGIVSLPASIDPVCFVGACSRVVLFLVGKNLGLLDMFPLY